MSYEKGHLKKTKDELRAEAEGKGPAVAVAASAAEAGLSGPVAGPEPGSAPVSPDVGPRSPEPPVAPPASEPILSAEEIAKKEAEEKAEKRLAELKEKMDDFDGMYAKYSGEAYASQGFISRLVGKHKERDAMIEEYRNRWTKAKGEYEQALNDDLEKKYKDGKISEKEYRKQSIQLKLDSLGRVEGNYNKRELHRVRKGESRGWLSDKVEKGMEKFIAGWRGLPFIVKFGGALALGVVGGPAATIGLSALRIIGAVAGGKASQELLQRKALEKRERDAEKEMREFEMRANLLDVNKLYNLTKKSLDKSNSELSEKIVSQANWDAYRKWAGIGIGIVMEELSRLGVTRELFNKGMEWSGIKGVFVLPESGSGKGAAVPEKVSLRPHGHVINQGENIWKVTRDIYMENPDGYDYKPSDPKIEKLYQSFRRQGILGKLGIESNDFGDLTNEEKLKIWAENKTANSIAKSKNIFNLVHAGDTVTVNPDGTIVFNEASGIKAGNLHDVQRPSGVADSYEPSGRKPAWLEALDEKQRAAQAKFAEAASISDRTHAALVESRGQLAAASAAEAAAMDNVQTHKWMDFIQERIYGKGTTVDWQQPAREFRNKFLGSFITSDQPMGSPANVGEQQGFWRAAQELNKKLGVPIGNETTEQWLTRGLDQGRISSEDAMRVLNKVVNQ